MHYTDAVEPPLQRRRRWQKTPRKRRNVRRRKRRNVGNRVMTWSPKVYGESYLKVRLLLDASDFDGTDPYAQRRKKLRFPTWMTPMAKIQKASSRHGDCANLLASSATRKTLFAANLNERKSSVGERYQRNND